MLQPEQEKLSMNTNQETTMPSIDPNFFGREALEEIINNQIWAKKPKRITIQSSDGRKDIKLNPSIFIGIRESDYEKQAKFIKLTTEVMKNAQRIIIQTP